MIRLATWNLCSGRSMTDGTISGPALEAAASLVDADVVALQEVDRGQERSGLVDQAAVVAAAVGSGAWHRFAAAVAGTPGAAWTEADDPDATGGPLYGVALVSRLPVISTTVLALRAAPVRIPLPVPDETGRPRAVWLADEPRRALVAVLEGPAGPFTVCCTHLSFVPGWNAWQLRRLLPQLVASPGPRFLLGDLNLPGRIPRRLAPGWRGLTTAPTWPVRAPRVQLDHVLAHGFTGTVSAARTVDAGISDHRALLVDVHP